jgi:hypothetical protein
MSPPLMQQQMATRRFHGKADCHWQGRSIRLPRNPVRKGNGMPLSIGKAWDDAKAAIAANRRLVTPVALGLILVPAVVSAMVEPRAVPGEQPEAGPWMIVMLVMIIVMLAGQMAIVLLTNGWQGSVGEAIGRAVKRLPTLILAALMVMVPLLLILSVVLAVIGFATGGDGQFSATSLSPTGWLVILVGFVIILAVGVRLLPMIVLIASEEIGPVAAIKRAFALTGGHFWKLLGFMLMATIAFLIVAAAAGAVIGSVVSLLLGRPDPWSVSLLLVALAAGLIQAAFISIYTAMLTRITAQLTGGQAGVPEVKRAE